MTGGLLQLKNGRQAVFLADGVAGMTSILLYEAWLINKPVISIQPGLRRQQLDIFRKRKGIFCVTEICKWNMAMTAWMCEINKSGKFNGFRKGIELHMQAPYKVGKIIIDYLSNKKTKEQLL
jgi:hypothetical protein